MEDDETVQFLLEATNALVGGRPALAVTEDTKYSVWPMCVCEHCQGFRDTFESKFSDDLLEAMRVYADDMEAYSASLDTEKVLH
jgi:hypothetical protein